MAIVLQILLLAVGVVTWAASLYGTLLIGQLPGDWGHSICGPWGCGPPIQALVSFHLFWFILLAAPAGVAIYFANRFSLQVAGYVFLVCCGVGVAAVVLWQTWAYLPLVPDGQPAYFLQRCGLMLAMQVDVPIIQTGLMGAAFLGFARFKPIIHTGSPFATDVDDAA